MTTHVHDTLDVRIARRTQETSEVISLELQALNDTELPAFCAGAHIDLHIAPGLIRQYSLCNAPTERGRYIVGILRDPMSRGGSQAIHHRFQEGDVFKIGAPRNHFPLVEKSPCILLGGGIGITPLLCMAEVLHTAGTTFTLHYCVRSRQKAAFLERIERSPFADRVQLHCDDEDVSQKLDIQMALSHLSETQHIYVCGPVGFVDWVCGTSERLGIPDARVHREYFTGKHAETSENQAFEVKIATSSQVFQVPADRSICSVLHDAGIEIYTSCEAGTCGTCVTGVLQGEIDHRDVFLTDVEHASGKVMTPCCSRARTSMLVLDL
ncbi:vanillate O-demethylase ferredoxin subunit [Variovorax boronicumulans]|uniref:Vanillate O-demethylase ferredoxin subunit n=1 Tax=Variovorax boronicumulans TaxID=436515 RepID=A0AAW8DUS1_9BURK|nr:PDR/VanB family oxidoreductase [Variovorax boronicumulans]MDP9877652.1 vanillate O-demethylase ferredoxin subunit [Variovorax boronicumulans]MDP9922937.1 vanillate O-demethylase ferredoxin subunit [Variovorax boronicumulans]